MPVTARAANRFQQALEGGPAADADTAQLVQTARALSSVPTSTLAPREEFVAALRERLMAEAATLPTPSPAAAQAAADRRAAGRSAPVVVLVGRGLPRVLVGAAASVLAVGAVVGVASRSAIPGSALYPVKGWLDSVAVQIAGSDLERGLTHLSQAQEHITDTRTLSEQRDPEAERYIESLEAAISSVRAGQRDLDTAFDTTGNPQALIAVRDFAARARPQVEALRPEVPAAALPALGELQSLLAESEGAALRRLAACAPGCVTLQPAAANPSDLPTLPGTAGTTGPLLPGQVVVPGTAVTAAPRGGPGLTAGSGGVTLDGRGGGGATLSTGGAAVNGPTVSASAPGLPGATATLPSVGVSTDGVGATVPQNTLGGITVPGVTATLPLP
jgi:hypothetical protein